MAWGGTAKHKDFVERTDTHTERFVHFRKKWLFSGLKTAKYVTISLKMFSFTKIFCIFKIESVYLWNETQHCMVSIYILPLQQRKYTKGNSVF